MDQRATHETSASNAASGLLAGVRVVEFSHMVMGPSAGMIFGDLGADVIKVEPPGGDNTRRLAGSGAGFFAAFNRNKRSIAIDLKSTRGRDLAIRLAASADVLTENFRPGALEALGLGYDALSALNPRLIYCSMKGFLTGPYEHRTALDEVVQMLGGLAYMTGPPGRPLRAGASVNDIMGGMFGVVGVLAALVERQRTGRGRLIKAGLFENNMHLMAPHMMQFAVTGEPAAPMPNRLAAWAIYDVFDTADADQIFVGVVSDGQWASFCAAFGLDDLAHQPGLGSNRERVQRRDSYMPRVRALFQTRSRDEIAEICESIGLPFAPINRPQDLFDDPHLNHPGAMTPITLPDGRRVRSPSLPIEVDGERCIARHDVPRTGQHGLEVAHELGLSLEEAEELAQRGVIWRA